MQKANEHMELLPFLVSIGPLTSHKMYLGINENGRIFDYAKYWAHKSSELLQFVEQWEEKNKI